MSANHFSTPAQRACSEASAGAFRLSADARAWDGLLTPYLETDLNAGSFSAARVGFVYTRGAASLKLRHGFRPGSDVWKSGHELSLLGEIRF